MTAPGPLPMPASSRNNASRSPRLLVIVELVIIIAIFLGDRYLPVSKTPYLSVLGWVSLRLRRLGWIDVGFVRPRSWLLAKITTRAICCQQ